MKHRIVKIAGYCLHRAPVEERFRDKAADLIEFQVKNISRVVV